MIDGNQKSPGENAYINIPGTVILESLV